MQTVNEQIDTSIPAGRHLLREVEQHPKIEKIEYHVNEGISEQNTYTHDEFWNHVEGKLNNHYETDFKLVK
jgi:hypothetical protein